MLTKSEQSNWVATPNWGAFLEIEVRTNSSILFFIDVKKRERNTMVYLALKAQGLGHVFPPSL